jgi:hypothetical protein
MRNYIQAGVSVGILLLTSALLAQTPSGLIDPATVTYLGAFRLPSVSDGNYGTFDYSFAPIAYYPNGDPNGSGDGFPGSLFIAGHPYQAKIAEVSIPTPVVTQSVDALPVATILQPFTDLRIAPGYPMGMTYLASENRIYYTTSDDYIDSTASCLPINVSSPNMPPSIGMFSPNLSAASPRGAWYLNVNNTVVHPYMTSRYLMEVPKAAADASFGGRTLMSGRHRGWCSTNGPQLYAWTPVGSSPPPDKGTLPAKTVMQYGVDAQSVNGFSPTNNYQGAIWVSTSTGSAVIISGLLDFDPARAYYGYDDWKLSTQCDGIVPFPCSGPRGWRAADPRAAFLFYNPADLAAIAAGSKQSWQVQPYARLDLSKYMLKPYPATMNMNENYAETIVTSIDRARGLIYVSETRVENQLKPVIHVFKVGSGSGLSLPSPPTNVRVLR